MKTQFKLAIGLLCLLTYPIFSNDYSISLTLVPRATYYASTLVESVRNKQKLDQIASITIVNNTTTQQNFKLRIRVRSSVLNAEIADITTIPGSSGFPIVVDGNSTKIITNQDIDPNSSGLVTTRIDSKSIENLIRDNASYGRDAILANDGIVPEDSYTYTIQLFLADDDDTGTARASISETLFQPLEKGNISLISPQNDQVLTLDNPYPTFIWAPLRVRSGVNANYQIRVWEVLADGPKSADAVILTDPILNETVSNETTFDYPSSAEALKPDTTYYWNLVARDDVGYLIGKGQSENWRFKIDEIAPASLSQPVSDISQLPVEFRWSEVVGASKYHLVIDSNPGFSDPRLIIDLDEKSHVFDDEKYFQPEQDYYWYVQAYDDAGEPWGRRSEVAKFRFDKRVALLAPVDATLLSLPPEFSWTAVPGAGEYTLALSKDSSFSDPFEYTVGETSAVLSADLFEFEPEATYYWRVQAKGPDGDDWGKPSEVSRIDMPQLAVPQLIAPLDDGVQGLSPVFQFSGVPWAESYKVEVSDQSGNWADAVRITAEGESVAYPGDANPLRKDKQYFWRVVPSDEDGRNYGKTSKVWSFRTPAVKPSQLEDPIDQYIKLPYVFRWSSVEGAGRYELIIGEGPGLDNFRSFDVEGTSLSVDGTGFKSELGYYWTIQAYDANGEIYGDRSAAVAFRLVGDETASLVPALVSPLGERLKDLETTFKWVEIPGAEGYILRIAETADMGDAKAFTVKGNQVQLSTLGLDVALGKTYHWTIQAQKEGKDYASVSSIGSFSVPLFQVGLADPLSKTLNLSDVAFSWEGVPGASSYRLDVGVGEALASRNSKIVSATTAKVGDLVAGQSYRWQVTALDADGNVYGKASELGSFTVAAAGEEIAAPVLDVKPSYEAASGADIESFTTFLKSYLNDKAKQVLDDTWMIESMTIDGKRTLNKYDLKALMDGDFEIKSVRVD